MNPDDPDYVLIEAVLRAGITDAYRLGIGTAIQIVELFRGSTLDVEAFDQLIKELRRQSAGAEKTR